MSVRVLIAGVIVACTAAACRGAPDIDRDEHAVRIGLHGDGSLQIVERIRVRVSAASRLRLKRPLDRHDAIADVVASLNGTDVSRAGQSEAASITIDRGLDVEWALAAGAQEVDVRYRVLGSVAVRGGHAQLTWDVLPELPRGAVAYATVVLELPQATLLSAEPRIEESGWTITRTGSSFRAEKRAIAPGETARLVVPFLVDPRALHEPQWQINAERAVDLLPAFISGALFILVVGAGIVIMVRMQYPRATAAAGDPARVAAARGLRVGGLATMVFGLLMTPVVQWTLGHFGPWPLVLPAATIIVGLGLIAYGLRRQV